jgi:hypothetical protein
MTTQSDIIDCFSCGRSMVYRGRRFCSDHCREWFDAGFTLFEPLDTRRYSLRLGKHGFLIDCSGCGRRFDSKGLRCCSTECERRSREREKNQADMLDAPAEKRRCEECGGGIPRWRNGRKVSKATRFCSDKCSARARQVPRVQNGGVVAPNAKEVPISSSLAEGVSRGEIVRS